MPTTFFGVPPILAGLRARRRSIILPPTNGATMIVDQAEFDAERWYRILQGSESHGLVHRADRDPHVDESRVRTSQNELTCTKLRLMASVGEPLNPEAVVWGVEAFGKPFHDNWWQTETGGIMISNFRGHGRQAGIDGSAASRCDSRDRRAR